MKYTPDYKRLIDISSVAVFEADIYGKILYSNKKGLEMFGYSKEDLENSIFFTDLIAFDFIEEMRSNMSYSMDTRKPIRAEYIAVKKNGDFFPISVYTETVIENDKPVKLLGIVTNITKELKSSQKEARNRVFRELRIKLWKTASRKKDSSEEEMIDSLFALTGRTLDVSRVCLSKIDNQENLFVAREWLNTGVMPSSKELRIPKELWEFFFKKEFVVVSIETIERMFDKTEFLEKYKTFIEQAFHQEQIKSVVYFPFFIDDKLEGVMSFDRGTNAPGDWDPEEIQAGIDLKEILSINLERMRAYQEILKAKEKSEQANNLKDIFLANISHEIRTPLNGIMGMTELLNMTPVTEEQRKYIKDINYCNNSLMVIIEDLLDLSRMKSDIFELKTTPFSVEKLSLQVIRNFAMKAKEKKIELIFSKDTNLPNYILGDPERIKQILLNLMSNAIKFTENGSVELYIESEKVDFEHFILKFNIKDTGIGIEEEDLKNIFESFYQAENFNKFKIKGTGLGLAISKELAHKMKGRISVKSKKGAGSTFTFQAKFRVVDTLKKEKPNNNTFITDNENSTKKILICEDDPINLSILEHFLKKKNYQYITAKNGVEAIKQFKKEKPSIIFMDIRMPIKDGMEATKEIREFETNNNLEKIPIIALTANATIYNKDEFANIGFDDVLPKPLTFNRFYSKLTTYLETDEK